MGYAVLHLEKTSGTDSGMSGHIERKIAPKNVDQARTYLNRELINFPEGVNNRTEAIQHRIETAGLKRKIGNNQVRAVRILLTGSPEDMKRIQAEGRLDEWCKDNLKWLEKTYGKENIVSAVLHMDETTPHIHATMVPIITGERRKAKIEKENNKRKYRKKDTSTNRLCADDVMSRVKLKEYQNTYAESMQAYGLSRGIEGSEAKHVNTSQYYRDLLNQSESIQENINMLLQQQEQATKEYVKIKKEIKTEKLKSTAVNVATNAIEGIGSLFNDSKTKQQQQEIESLREANNSLKEEIRQLNNHIVTMKKEHKEETDTLTHLLDKVYTLFPAIKEWLRIEELCRLIGFGKKIINNLIHGKTVTFSGELYSPEFKRRFATEHSTAKVEPHPQECDTLRLMIDEVEDCDWFRNKHKEYLQITYLTSKQTEGHKDRKRFKV